MDYTNIESNDVPSYFVSTKVIKLLVLIRFHNRISSANRIITNNTRIKNTIPYFIPIDIYEQSKSISIKDSVLPPKPFHKYIFQIHLSNNYQ